jgi:hypothetical protein
MSLKHVHVAFITMTLALMAFLGRWALGMRQAGQSTQGLGAVAVVGGVLGLAYLGWFLRKYRTLS